MKFKHWLHSYKLVDSRFWKTFIADMLQWGLLILLGILFTFIVDSLSSKYLPGIQFGFDSLSVQDARPDTFISMLSILAAVYLVIVFLITQTIRYFVWHTVEKKKIKWDKIWPFFGYKAILYSVFGVIFIFVVYLTGLNQQTTESWLPFLGQVLIVILLIKVCIFTLFGSLILVGGSSLKKTFKQLWKLPKKDYWVVLGFIILEIILFSIVSLILKPLPQVVESMFALIMVFAYISWVRVYVSDYKKRFIKLS